MNVFENLEFVENVRHLLVDVPVSMLLGAALLFFLISLLNFFKQSIAVPGWRLGIISLFTIVSVMSGLTEAKTVQSAEQSEKSSELLKSGSSMDHGKMDHSTMNHKGMKHEGMTGNMNNEGMKGGTNHEGMEHYQGMQHEGMNGDMKQKPSDKTVKSGSSMDHGKMDHSTMNHKGMKHEGMSHKSRDTESKSDSSMNHSKMNHSKTGSKN